MSKKLILPIVRMGHPSLSKKAKLVENPSSPETQLVAKQLIDSAHANGNAAGLAAPQIDIPLRIFIYRIDDEGDFTVVINPTIEPMSEETELQWEACLSLPDVAGQVSRYKKVRLTYQDLAGQEIVCELSDYEARVVQHEADHLDGILFVQRMTDMSQFGYIDEIRKYAVRR